MPIPLGILAAQAPPAPAGAYELISTTILTSNAASVTFSSIPQDYKHLQIRYTAKNSGGALDVNLTFNGVTTGNQRRHHLRGTGTAVQSSTSGNNTSVIMLDAQASSSGTSVFAAGIIDFLDYTNSAKNPVVRAFYGQTGSGAGDRVYLLSGLLPSAQAVTSVQLTSFANNFVAGSRFSLYGIRG